MWHLHPNSRTTPAVRAEIAGSQERTGVLAQRYGVSTETVRRWRQRGVEDCWDHSARPHQLPWKATAEERAVVCALRRATNFALDDLTFVVIQFLPQGTPLHMRVCVHADVVPQKLALGRPGRRWRPPPGPRHARRRTVPRRRAPCRGGEAAA